MGPFSISRLVVEAVQLQISHHADDEGLLQAVQAACPAASHREVSRAALYLALDPDALGEEASVRLFQLGMNLRQVA